jgi:hypothetical protein
MPGSMLKGSDDAARGSIVSPRTRRRVVPGVEVANPTTLARLGIEQRHTGFEPPSARARRSRKP